MQHSDEQQQSPIWSIDLFERRQFRNGNAEAQCLECGQRFDTTEFVQMTGHLVQWHPEYAAKLVAQQLALDEHKQQLQRQQQTKRDEEEVVAAEVFNDRGERREVEQKQQQKQQIHVDETNATHCDSGLPMRDDISLTTTNTSSSWAIPTALKTETTPTSNLNDTSNYMDRFGKPWRLLASVVDGTKLDQIADQKFLCRKGQQQKHDGRIYYGCKWNSVGSQKRQRCIHRALYVPWRQALFYRRTHNHTVPAVAEPQNITANNTGICNNMAKMEVQSSQQQTELRENSNNDDNVSAFSAALPDIDDAFESLDRKDLITPISAASLTHNRPPYRDHRGKHWHWLFDVDDIMRDQERIRQFCQEHFLIKSSEYPRRIIYTCKLNKRKSVSARGRCPYRALYVAERGAMFAVNSHNHAPLKVGDIGGFEIAGCSNSSSIDAQQDASPISCHGNNDNTKVDMSINTVQNDANDSTFVLLPKNGQHDNEYIQQCVPPPLRQAAEGAADFVDFKGKAWKWLTAVDIGQDAEHPTARQQLLELSSRFGLYRYSIRRDANGTLRVLDFACREWRRNKYCCSYRAVYVVERRAMFDRGYHDHTKRKAAPKKRMQMIGKNQGRHSMPSYMPNRGTSSSLSLSLAQSSFAAVAPTNDHMHISQMSASDQKLPSMIIDRFRIKWHWLKQLPDSQNSTVLDFMRQFYVHQHWISKNSMRTVYACRYRRAPIRCPYRLMHLRDRDTLYHRMAHNHPLPLSAELMQRYTQQRQADRRLWTNRRKALAAKISGGGGTKPNGTDTVAGRKKATKKGVEQQQAHYSSNIVDEDTEQTVAVAAAAAAAMAHDEELYSLHQEMLVKTSLEVKKETNVD